MSFRRIVTAACGLAASLSAVRADNPATWPVGNASMRVELNIEQRPNLTDAGCIALIPDGGLLPRPAPGMAVTDESGRKLRCGCLWYDPAQAMAVVFEPPAGNRAFLYLARAPKLMAWTPESGLTPGVCAYVRRGGDGLGAARQLASRFPPGHDVFFLQLSDIAIGALPQGLSGRFSDYLLGYVVTKDPGKTWIAVEPSEGGQMELLVDGKKLSPQKAFPQASGSTGDWVTLTNRPVRVEMFTQRPTENARLRMAWKPPHAGHQELGGDNPVHQGQSMWAARPLVGAECVTSGKAGVARIELRSGDPVAAYSYTPEGYFWFPNVQPLILYRFSARTSDNPGSAAYKWEMGGETRITGKPEIRWFFEAYKDVSVRLTVANGSKQGQCVYDLYPFCSGHQQYSIESADHVRLSRDALVDMLAAAPPDKDPTASWTESVWDLYFRLLDPVETRALVEPLFAGKRWELVRKRIPDAQRWLLEDILFDARCASNPKEALDWLEKFDRAERSGDRKEYWNLKRVELQMYYFDNLAEARKLATTMAAERSAYRQLAQVRLGDVALLGTNYDEAVRIYGEAERSVNHTQKASGAADAPASGSQSHLARSGKELREQQAKKRAWLKSLGTATGPGAADDWRVGAVRDTAVSETARNFLKTRAFFETQRALTDWEREFPMAKLDGDYLVVEAGYRMALGDYAWPARSLAAYCTVVDVTPALPEAVKLALRCLVETGTSDAKLNAFAMEMKKRFKYHPIGGEIDSLLDQCKRDKRK